MAHCDTLPVPRCSVTSDSLRPLWALTCQAPLPMDSSRQEYWSGLPFPTPGHLPDPGIELASPTSPALAGGSLPLHHLGSPVVRFQHMNKHKHSRCEHSVY